ncbi:MAG: sigma-70 family RNA polymerase sigma factor [Cyclobacteriaceae bacterium]|nr:sigma-70 family RNA polymerase sigma factor [Cyclobacteriaceae bacterium]
MATETEKTFVELINAHQRLVHKVCNLYAETADERKDLFQEIVLQLWRSYHTFRGEAKFSTWMYRIALNTAIGGWRKSSRQPYFEKMNDGHYNLGSPVEPDKEEQIQNLYKAIRQLPEVDRALIMLALEDIPYEEIAATVGLTQNNVRVRMLRIREKLKKALTHGA